MAKSKINEVELIQACLEGNSNAFEGLVSKYQPLICAITYSATGDVGKSEELAQEIFIKAWKELGKLRELTKFKAWLCSIARTTICTHFRREKKNVINKAVPIESAESSHVEADASENISSKEQQKVVAQAILQLHESYREPLILFYRHHQSIKEIADQLEISEGNARTRLYRGRKMLKEQVAAMIENSLKSTAPGKAFTAGVMASVAGLAVKGSAAAGTAAFITSSASGSAGTSTGISAVMSTVTAKIVTGAVVLIVAAGSVITYYNMRSNNETSQLVVNEKTKISYATKTDQENNIEDTAEQNHKDDDSHLAKSISSKNNIIFANSDGVQGSNNNSGEAESSDIEEKFDGHKIIVKVIEKDTGKPVVGAPIGTYRGKAEYFTADKNGELIIKLPKNEHSINIFARPKGYVWQSFSCGKGRFMDYFPEEVIFALDKGNVVGGVVHDPNGNPIAGAEVSFECLKGINDHKPDIDLRFRQMTGPDGKWQCISAPENLMMCRVSAGHPKYAAVGEAAKEKEVSSKLKEQTHVLTLNKGFFISGIVTDEAGNPIEKARIQLGQWYGASERSRRTYTDTNGYYEFTNRNKGGTYVTVTAKGFAPEAKVASIEDKSAVVDFIITKGSPLYGRVVDTAGNAIAGALVRADDWRYARPNGIRSLDWHTKTDSEGRFVWEHAPEEIVELAVSKAGFMTFETPDVTPSDKEYEFVLYDKLRASGRVIDAVSKEPITEYSFRRYQGGYISSPKKIMDVDGKFSTAFDDQGEKYTISFEAEGYSPIRSREISLGEQDVELLVEMIPHPGIDGVIVDANGAPLGNIGVIIPKDVLHIENMKYDVSRLRYHHFTKTDPQGHFRFDPIGNSNYSLLVLQDDGYVCTHAIDFPEDGIFTLQPYAKIEGYYFEGSRPVAGHKIKVDYPDYLYKRNGNTFYQGKLSVTYSVETDKDGKFVLDRLIHGRARILVDPYKYVSLEPGEVKEIFIGANGPAVVGQLVNFEGSIINHNTGECQASLQRIHDSLPFPEEEMPLPANHQSMNYFELFKWFSEFGSSEEGTELRKQLEVKYGDLNRSYSINIDNNGRFEVPNVEPGKYLLSAKLRPWKNSEKLPPRKVDYYKMIASASMIIDVHECSTLEEMDKLVDAGVIKCRKAPLEVGMQAPEFEIQKLKSKGSIKLSDYRGKIVLVNFVNPVLKEAEPDKTRMIEQACRQIGSRDDFVIINVAMEMIHWEYMREKMAQECTLPGIYGVAQIHNSPIYIEYELGPLPESVLIDKAGKIIWKGAEYKELFELLKSDL